MWFGGATLALALAAAAFAHAGRGSAAPAAGPVHVVRAVERDFRITLSPSRVPAGTVAIEVSNRGPDAHELIVVRDDGGLPLRSDGITVDEEALAKRTVETLEPAGAGAARRIRVRLRPGRYILLCNMFGHYMGGMHAPLVVR